MEDTEHNGRVELVQQLGLPILRIIAGIAGQEIEIILSLLGSYVEQTLKKFDDPLDRQQATMEFVTMLLDRMEIPYDTSYKN